MSNKANPTVVGTFVVAGLVLALGCVILFGSLQWFAPVTTFVIYFEDSAAGLEAGSPVKLRGVRIGTVKEVMIHFNQATNDLYLPVLVEIDHRTLDAKIDPPVDLSKPRELERFIQDGLRAMLELESFVTGRLLVNLTFDTNAPPPVFHQTKPLYPEIPSSLNDISQLRRSITKVNFAAIAEGITNVLARLDHTLAQLDVPRIVGAATNFIHAAEQLVRSPEVTNSLIAFQKTADQFRALCAKLEQQVDPLAGHAEETLEDASQTLAEARRAIAEIRGLLASTSPLRTELDALLTDLADAASSVAALAEMLRRNPQSLIQGRQRLAR